MPDRLTTPAVFRPRFYWAGPLTLFASAMLTALPALAAPPNFDAGALLEQLNRQAVPKPVNPLLPADTKPREVLTSFEFRELPERLVPVAFCAMAPVWVMPVLPPGVPSVPVTVMSPAEPAPALMVMAPRLTTVAAAPEAVPLTVMALALL